MVARVIGKGTVAERLRGICGTGRETRADERLGHVGMKEDVAGEEGGANHQQNEAGDKGDGDKRDGSAAIKGGLLLSTFGDQGLWTNFKSRRHDSKGCVGASKRRKLCFVQETEMFLARAPTGRAGGGAQGPARCQPQPCWG